MKVEVVGVVGDGEVVTSQLRLGHVERHLVAGEPSLVATDS